jgi:hypothetical protein
MSEEKALKKLLKNPWVLGTITSILGTLIFGAISFIVSLISQINFLTALQIVFSTIVNFIVIILTINIPLWGIILGILLLFFLLSRGVNKIESAWLEFKSDRYKGWLLNWDYYLNLDNQYEIRRLRPVCFCGCELGEHFSRTRNNQCLYCPNCNEEYPTFYQQDERDALLLEYFKIKNYSNNK